jgi:hypothetical protein
LSDFTHFDKGCDMKETLRIVLTMTALCICGTQQVVSADWGLGIGFNAGVGRLEADLRNPRISPLISGHIKAMPVPFFGLSGELGFSPLSANNHPNPAFTDFKTTIIPFELSAFFNFLPFNKVNPYIFAGGGGVYWKATNSGTTLQDGVDSFLKTGGGLEFRVSRTIGINLGATYRFSLTEAFDQLFQGDENDQVVDVRAGLTYYFPSGANDRDRDIIPDELDLMPDIAEDRDGFQDHDGIPEKNPNPVAVSTFEAPFDNGNQTTAPVVIHHLVTTAESGSDLDIEANVYSNIGLKVVATIYRVLGTPNWNVVRMQKVEENLYEGVIPGYAVTREGLEYCVIAVDETVRGIGYSGLPSKPIQVKVSPSGKPWRIIGGTIGAATVGTASYLILRKQDR